MEKSVNAIFFRQIFYGISSVIIIDDRKTYPATFFRIKIRKHIEKF